LKEKELSNKSSLSKIKQIQSEYDTSYKKVLSDYNKLEEDLKNKFMEYKSIIEKQNEDNEKNWLDEILLLKAK
jgi:Skp family chaperone for outer membrane proteins